MQMKQRGDNEWEPLYPKTTADNVTTNQGDTLQEIIDESEPEIRFGDGYDETDGKYITIFKDNMFTMAQTITMSSLIQNKYLRSTVLIPFEDIEYFNIQFMIIGASGSIADTTHLYVREKRTASFQLSTIGVYEDGETVDVDILVTGKLSRD